MHRLPRRRSETAGAIAFTLGYIAFLAGFVALALVAR